MQIVIDIPGKTVNEIKDNAMFAWSISNDIRWDITNAIVNGTPLPKGHGRLIDADKLKHLYPENKAMHDTLNHAKTIIKPYGEDEQDG